jgi:tetratricopeptide (TPR) repeat protein
VNLDNAERFVDPILARDPKNPRALFIATTIAHDHMNLADSRGDRAEELKYAANAASLVERFMDTHPVAPHDLYSMRYFYLNIAGAFDAGRKFDKVVQYSQRALDISLPKPDENALRGEILSNFADARWQSGDLDEALKTAVAAIELEKAEAANGHASLRINLASGYDQEGMILGRQDAEPSLGRGEEALADLHRALDIAEDLAQKDATDYLSRHNVAFASLEIGNILRHRNARDALAAYDHALMRIREARSNASAQRDEAELLTASSYPLRWLGRETEAKQRIARAIELLNQVSRYPADKIEPMGDIYGAVRAQADDYAETGEVGRAVDAYQQLLDKLMAWNPNLQSDLRDATCISRTWTALASVLRRTGRSEEADRLERQRTDLWNQWNGRVPNAQFLLRQSLNQVAPRAALIAVSQH